MRQAPTPEWLISEPTLKEEEYLLPARVIEISSQFEDEKIREALENYAKHYFLQFEEGFTDKKALMRDDAYDVIKVLAEKDDKIRLAMYAVEQAGLDYKDFKDKIGQAA